MNKSPKERSPNAVIQAHRRSPGIILNFFTFFKIKQNIIRGGGEVSSYVLMWNILEEQVSMMETWKNS